LIREIFATCKVGELMSFTKTFVIPTWPFFFSIHHVCHLLLAHSPQPIATSTHWCQHPSHSKSYCVIYNSKQAHSKEKNNSSLTWSLIFERSFWGCQSYFPPQLLFNTVVCSKVLPTQKIKSYLCVCEMPLTMEEVDNFCFQLNMTWYHHGNYVC